ncbi:hypothetical protein NIIDMKKI_49550 [Mycobacterium kansasii]|uniref:Uncharacterized protein n=1 Tax=Mycobacterium kansasii TaxID=1768 RepID=A0A7G1IIY9_MYCKA|nr:hypothetical protein NIIDMKKI_49550 [Mycobacterium kansasii]
MEGVNVTGNKLTLELPPFLMVEKLQEEPGDEERADSNFQSSIIYNCCSQFPCTFSKSRY